MVVPWPKQFGLNISDANWASRRILSVFRVECSSGHVKPPPKLDGWASNEPLHLLQNFLVADDSPVLILRPMSQSSVDNGPIWVPDSEDHSAAKISSAVIMELGVADGLTVCGVFWITAPPLECHKANLVWSKRKYILNTSIQSSDCVRRLISANPCKGLLILKASLSSVSTSNSVGVAVCKVTIASFLVTEWWWPACCWWWCSMPRGFVALKLKGEGMVKCESWWEVEALKNISEL